MLGFNDLVSALFGAALALLGGYALDAAAARRDTYRFGTFTTSNEASMEAGVTCCCCAVPPRVRGVCLTPGTLGTSSRAACCPRCRGGPFVRPFMACPITS